MAADMPVRPHRTVHCLSRFGASAPANLPNNIRMRQNPPIDDGWPIDGYRRDQREFARAAATLELAKCNYICTPIAI
ncbi:hypothetical protein ACQPW1_05245 [Nocardia sp. CA-128927]|uniref:hypothetical protein n=1 Tax=Nocardia sp. CA-128927 TaxID=3239975 RepID=UPI003D9530F6